MMFKSNQGFRVISKLRSKIVSDLKAANLSRMKEVTKSKSALHLVAN